MNHLEREQVEFVRTRHTCDIGGECLLEGAKPLVCQVCERECCAAHSFVLPFNGLAGVVRLCDLCLYDTPWLSQLFFLDLTVTAARAALLASWSTDALARKDRQP